MSAFDVGVAVMLGRRPAPALIGALQTLISVPSEALKCSSSVNVSPAESFTLEVVALELFHTPTSTIRRLALPSAPGGVTARLETDSEWPETCCTNAADIA